MKPCDRVSTSTSGGSQDFFVGNFAMGVLEVFPLERGKNRGGFQETVGTEKKGR